MEFGPSSAELALVRQARERNRVAWTKLYETHAPILYRRVLLPKLGAENLAEDALAETFRAAIEKIELYDPERGPFFAWISRIAYNKAIDVLRREARRRRDTDVESGEGKDLVTEGDPESLLVSLSSEAEVRLRVLDVLEKINERYKTVLELRFLVGKSRVECATELEVKLETFDVVMLRALRAFKKEWESRTPGKEIEYGF